MAAIPTRVAERLRLTRALIRLVLNFAKDERRFWRYSSVTAEAKRSTAGLEALITMEYHRIEKGLALREPRPRFGAHSINNLVIYLEEYRTRPRYREDLFATAVGALTAYLKHHRKIGITEFEWEYRVLALASEASDPDKAGGTDHLVREQVLKAAAAHDLTGFFMSRRSIRHFVGGPVEDANIIEAVRIAQRTPSVCNRQATRVYVFRDEQQKLAVLKHQNGNRGFGDQADLVLLVTADLSAFVSVGERNQAWVDGGMFLSTLVWALHSQGLGSCVLNCSNEWQQDAALRVAAGVPEEEAVIAMLAVGELPEDLRVARSVRMPLGSVVRGLPATTP